MSPNSLCSCRPTNWIFTYSVSGWWYLRLKWMDRENQISATWEKMRSQSSVCQLAVFPQLAFAPLPSDRTCALFYGSAFRWSGLYSCTDILLSFVLIVFALLKISVFFLFFYFLAALTWLSCTLDSFETLWRSNWHTNLKKKPANPIRMFLSMILFQCKLEELQWRVSGCKLPQMCLFAGSRWTPSLFL